MISANELRIGNWVNIPECAINAQIVALTKTEFFIEQDSHDLGDYELYFLYESAHPIPLTPEILEKCGFEQDWVVVGEDREEFAIWKKGSIIFNQRLEASVGWDDVDIKHLHQLQNLYFAMTGKELNYNP